MTESCSRFRCRVGHAFSADSMWTNQSEALESALWTALRSLEENAALARQFAEKARNRNHTGVATRFDEKAHDLDKHAAVIREILMKDLNKTR